MQPVHDAVVLRFPPGGPDEVKRIRDEAKWVHRRRQRTAQGPWYRLSVWADCQRINESRDELMLRLIHAAGLGGIRLEDARNSQFWWSTVGELVSRGFLLKKDGYADEPYEHWSVDLGEQPPSVELVSTFVAAFRGPMSTGEVMSA